MGWLQVSWLSNGTTSFFPRYLNFLHQERMFFLSTKTTRGSRRTRVSFLYRDRCRVRQCHLWRDPLGHRDRLQGHGRPPLASSSSSGLAARAGNPPKEISARAQGSDDAKGQALHPIYSLSSLPVRPQMMILRVIRKQGFQTHPRCRFFQKDNPYLSHNCIWCIMRNCHNKNHWRFPCSHHLWNRRITLNYSMVPGNRNCSLHQSSIPRKYSYQGHRLLPIYSRTRQGNLHWNCTLLMDLLSCAGSLRLECQPLPRGRRCHWACLWEVSLRLHCPTRKKWRANRRRIEHCPDLSQTRYQ